MQTERNLGSYSDGGGVQYQQTRLTGNFHRDVQSGVFRIDESDPDYQDMYETVQSWRLKDPETGHRLDEGETAVITRQLLYVKAQTYDIKYPAQKARMFIPVSHDVPTGAEQWSYWSYDVYGMAKLIANYATDFPNVDVKVAEVKQGIAPIGASYTYTVQDLRRIAFMAANGTSRGANIDVKRAARARLAIEQLIDDIAAVGTPDAGFEGFLNNANVPVAAAPTGSWKTATSLQIIEDLNYGWQTIMNATNQLEVPDTWLLAPSRFNIIAGRPFSTLGNLTVAQWFIQNNPHIEEMDQWYKMEKADAAGTGPRCMCYRRDPNAVFLEIPQEFEQFAPQIEGMQYTVPCHARIGGVAFPYPLSALYMDGT